jgi:DNA invertase Pin-like site-specific DNA recombinase
MRVAGYVRLSRDEDKESYSSILSQKSMIEECAMQHDWSISKYYEDDNCSGYSFDRPAFNELMKDLEGNLVDVVIAKDLSRIGRHNAYTLLFLDKIKSLNKRMILPKEGKGYDTAKDENDLLGITTWYNEMYVKDISRKIKSSIKSRQKEGRMIIKEAFGYKRIQGDKHKLEIDPEAAEIVQKIFKLYLSGIGYRKIAELLNQEGCPTPSQYKVYKKTGESKGNKVSKLWNSVHVQRILKNDIYIGTLRLGKTEKRVIKGKSYKQTQENQYIFIDDHPSIISKEIFEEVQLAAERRSNNHSKGAASLNNIFSGLIYCQDCGSYMISYKKKGKPKSYICGTYHMYGNKNCTRHTIQEEFLKEAVRAYLKVLTEEFSTEISRIRLETNVDIYEDNEILLKKLLQEEQQIKRQYKHLIMQKVSEMNKDNYIEFQSIVNDSYSELENNLKARLLYLEKKVKELSEQASLKQEVDERNPRNILNEIINCEQQQKRYIEVLIDKIMVDDCGTPTIYMKTDFHALCYHNREDVNLVLDPLTCIWQGLRS